MILRGFFAIFFLLACSVLHGQNPNLEIGFGLGITKGGLLPNISSDHEVSEVISPQGSVRAKFRIGEKSAIGINIATIILGNRQNLSTPIITINGEADRLETRSALLAIDVLYRRYISDHWYVQGGPNVNYLAWSTGAAYLGDIRLFKLTETDVYNRWHAGATLSVGYTTKVDQSRKNAPWQVQVLWFIELKSSATINHAIKSIAGEESGRFGYVELSTGFTFGSIGTPTGRN